MDFQRFQAPGISASEAGDGILHFCIFSKSETGRTGIFEGKSLCSAAGAGGVAFNKIKMPYVKVSFSLNTLHAIVQHRNISRLISNIISLSHKKI